MRSNNSEGENTMPLVIEYPMTGATYSRDEYGVYEYDVYPESSVLAGQERRRFLNSFETLAAAKKAYPEAETYTLGAGTGYREITIPHTPPAWFDPMNAGETWDDADY